jgi:lipid II:glycine glycyltransferase (peptidoglycan interpeptide bridge formation enzyme)
MKSLGWQVEQVGKTHAFIKQLPVVPFSVIKVLRYHPPLNSRTIDRLRRDHRALIVKQEPFLVNKIHGAMTYFQVQPKNRWPLVPTKTLWLDLALSEAKLLTQMKSKTRYNIRKAERENFQSQVVSGDKIDRAQLEQFYKLWSCNKPHNWLFHPHFSELKSLVNAFGEKCYFVLTWKLEIGNWKLIAGALILQSNNMAFYWHNASTSLGRKLHAPTLCVWRAIREAKRLGLTVFDFEGVWDERFPQLNKDWKGFTRFKLGFVGTD